MKWSRSVKIKSIIEELSIKYGLPKIVVENIIYTQFEFVRNVIDSGLCYTVKLPRLGKFEVEPIKLNTVYEKYKDNFDDELKGTLIDVLCRKYQENLDNGLITKKLNKEKLTKDLPC